MSLNAAMRELARSSDFFEHVAHLKQAVKNERQPRERFYECLPDEAKTEFTNGRAVVHVPAPRVHQRAIFFAANLLGESEGCLVRCQRNDYAPDICFFDPMKCANLARDQRISPPDLVVEVLSPATEMNDRTLKFFDYARHGVGELWRRCSTHGKTSVPWQR